MKLQELNQPGPSKIILLSGKLCSGKGYCSANLYSDFKHIVVSGIVKRLSKATSRSELTKTQHLDDQIASALISEIQKYDEVVVDGIRQLSIVKQLIERFGDIVELVWVEVPKAELKQRFEQRKDKKDDTSFEQALEFDSKLGLDEVERFMKKHGTVIRN